MADTVHQPFVPVAQVCRFRISGLWQGAPWAANFAFKYNGDPPTASQLITVAGSISTGWNTAWGTFYPINYSWNNVTVWDISSDTGASGVDGTSHTASGTSLTLPTVQAAVAISWHVNVRYRGGHFRTYMPLKDLNGVTGGRLMPDAMATSYATNANNFRSAVNAIQLNGSALLLGGVHYLPPRVVPKNAGQFYDFQPAVTRHRIDSQRRRMGKELT